MNDGLEHGNLISKSEAYLSFLLFSSWKDIFEILKSCETISSWAKSLQILNRCAEAIAGKACIDPKLFTLNDDDVLSLDVLANTTEDPKHEGIVENWWSEDVSCLRIGHFIEVIEWIRRKGMRPELVGSCVVHWTARWFSQIPFGFENLPKRLTHHLLRVTAESLIRVLPEENAASCNFLLHLLKLRIMTKTHSELLNKLDRRIALTLENCHVSDLLVKNYSNDDPVYDVGIITRVVKVYVSSEILKNPARISKVYVSSEILKNPARISVVRRLVDGYLTLVARDAELSVQQFQSLAEALPKTARYCDDKLYTAIDTFLKAHPRLAEEERTAVCKAMDYHKLSQEGFSMQ